MSISWVDASEAEQILQVNPRVASLRSSSRPAGLVSASGLAMTLVLIVAGEAGIELPAVGKLSLT